MASTTYLETNIQPTRDQRTIAGDQPISAGGLTFDASRASIQEHGILNEICRHNLVS